MSRIIQHHDFAIEFGKLITDPNVDWKSIVGEFHANKMEWMRIKGRGKKEIYEWRYGTGGEYMRPEHYLINIVATVLVADKHMGVESVLDLTKRLIKHIEVKL